MGKFAMLALFLTAGHAQAGWFGPGSIKECQASVSQNKLWVGARRAYLLSCYVNMVDEWGEAHLSKMPQDQRDSVEATAVCIYDRGMRDEMNDERATRNVVANCSKDDFAYRFFLPR